MSDNATLAFDELVAFRQQLQTFCYAHYPSLMKFAGDISFKLHLKEEGPKPTSHLSSTATCIESLLECPETFLPDKRARDDIKERAKKFALAAIERKNWQSEGSAKIYCRCRTLPLVIAQLSNFESQISRHLREISTSPQI
jgi:hypothetical protein